MKSCQIPVVTVKVFFLACVFSLTATVSSAEEADDRVADHEALRQLKAIAEEAINTNQIEQLRPYLDDPFSVVTYTDREFTDFDAFYDRWQKTRKELLAGGSYATKMIPERSQLFGDIAVCRGNSENILVTGGGDKFEFESHWSAVCRKVDGQWKIVRAHSSLSPFDNPMIKSEVISLLIKVGVGTLFAGLLLGWLSRTFLWKNRATPAGAATPDEGSPS